MKEALKLALEALQKTQSEGYNLPATAISEAITAIEAALAQPEQEPMVIYVVKYQTGYDYAEFVSYHQNKDDAKKRAKKINKDSPGIDAYVDDIKLE